MWTIMVTAATLVAAVGSVELDKYRYHSTAVFLLYAVSRVLLRAESKFSTGTPMPILQITISLSEVPTTLFENECRATGTLDARAHRYPAYPVSSTGPDSFRNNFGNPMD